MTPNRRQIVFDDYYGDLRLGDLRTGAVLKTLLPKASPRQRYQFAVAPDNKTMAVAHRDYRSANEDRPLEIELWDLNRGVVTGTLKQPGTLSASLYFSRDSRELAVGDHRQMTVWDVGTRTVLGAREMEPPLFRCQWSRNQRRYVGERFRTFVLVDALTGRPCAEWKCFDWNMKASAFSPDGTLLALSAPEGPVFVIDVYGKHVPNDLRDLTELSKFWEQLASSDATEAFRAIGGLIRRPDAAVAYLKQRLMVPGPTPADVARWINELDASDFERRDHAERSLRSTSSSVLAQLAAALEHPRSAEQRKRLEELVKSHQNYLLAPARLRELRCIEVLEAIGSKEARDLLVVLSDGPAEARLTRDAQAALEQMPKATDRK